MSKTYGFSGAHQIAKDGLFIELSDGERWYPARDDNEITIEALAHGMSNLCRFTGHCAFFYSIAEHSVKVSYLVESLTGLLHDAHEVVTNDLSKPVKVYIGGSYGELEDKCERQVATLFGLDFPHGPVIKEADILMVLIESFDLLPSKGKEWGYYDEFRQKALELYVDRPELRPEGWSPEEAYERFMARYFELSGPSTNMNDVAVLERD